MTYRQEKIVGVLFVYLVASIILWTLRFTMGADCKLRYIDYIFPITKLHCEIK